MIFWNTPKTSTKKLLSYLALVCLVTGCGGSDNTESLFATNASSTAAAANDSNASNNSKASLANNGSSKAQNPSKSSAGADITAPVAPASLARTALYSSRVDLNWSTASDNVAVTQYRIYRDDELLTTTNANTLNYSDKSAAQDTPYRYGVSAGDAAGNWSIQQILEVKTPVATVNGDVSLSWIAPTERESGAAMLTAELAGYEIKYRSITEIAFTVVTIPKAETMVYVFKNLMGDYEFQIAAFDNNFVYSNFVALSPR
jgi:hypothetical protein